MSQPLRLLCCFAHPDDESLGTGGTLARYAAEGVETYLVTATRGERGWFGDPDQNPGLEALGRLREQELRAAVELLGVTLLGFLDYVDGDLDQADPVEATAKIVTHLRLVRPQVVITFDPTGAYGHPDHIAICQLTTAAVLCAADADYPVDEDLPPHRVSKLYYMQATAWEMEEYQRIFGDVVMHVDGVERRATGWPEWALTTFVDTGEHWRTAWDAILCHRTQLPGYAALQSLPDDRRRALWRRRSYYRALSTVNGGREVETDLFAGLRSE